MRMENAWCLAVGATDIADCGIKWIISHQAVCLLSILLSFSAGKGGETFWNSHDATTCFFVTQHWLLCVFILFFLRPCRWFRHGFHYFWNNLWKSFFLKRTWTSVATRSMCVHIIICSLFVCMIGQRNKCQSSYFICPISCSFKINLSLPSKHMLPSRLLS